MHANYASVLNKKVAKLAASGLWALGTDIGTESGSAHEAPPRRCELPAAGPLAWARWLWALAFYRPGVISM